MAAAIVWIYLYLLATRELNLLGGGLLLRPRLYCGRVRRQRGMAVPLRNLAATRGMGAAVPTAVGGGHGINLTCVADGTLLNFLTTGEICTIVGTALDNATESVLTEQDPEKRLIRVAVYAQNGFVMLQFENYCAQPVELGPDGLPRQSSHGGYDLKSVRAAAETHGGTVTLHWENEWFTLRVLLPQKNEL